MDIDLTPNGRPSSFSGACALPGEMLFAPVLFDGGAKIIAGGPRLLGIFDAKGGTPLLELPCKTEHGIAGFCLFEGIIYLQDGPVLGAWHAVNRELFAARNLSTEQTWSKEDGPLDADFYDYSEDDAGAASLLLAAHNRHAWASLLAELAPQQETRAGALSLEIRKQLGFAEKDAQLVKAEADASLRKVKQSVAKIVFSGPVAREYRRSGAGGNAVFTLGMNGSVYAMDAALEEATRVTRGDDLPLRPELVIADINNAGDHGCRLYYATVSGGITVLDGASSNLNQLAGWSGEVPPDATKVLPLQYHDGVLMGGGMLGADFFVADVAQPGKLAQQVPAPSGSSWTTYQVDPKNQLVAISNGTASRLHAYGAGAVVRNRWGLRQSSAPVYLSVAHVEPKKKPLAWLLETDVGTAGGKQPSWRALYVNTVDSFINNPVYRPDPMLLASGTLKPHTIGKAFSYGWIRSRPLVNETDIFCVVRENPAGLLQASLDASSSSFSSAYDLEALQQQMETGLNTVLLRASATVPQPVAGSVRDALVNFDLKTHREKLDQAAAAEHQRMLLRTDPVPAAIVMIRGYQIDAHGGINPEREIYSPKPLAFAALELELTPGGKLTVTSDKDGKIYVSRFDIGANLTLSAASAARFVLPKLPMMPHMPTASTTCNSVKVTAGSLPTLLITVTIKSGLR